MKFKAIIFDFDGVIANSTNFNRDVISLITKELNIPFEKDDYEKYFVGHTVFDATNNFLESKGMSYLYDECIELKKTYDSKFPTMTKPFLDTIGFIQKYLGECKMGIGTGCRRLLVESFLKHSKFENIFDAVITVEDVFNVKPDPEVYLKVISALNIDPQESLVIEDTPNGIISAKRAGAFCLAVTHTYTKDYLHEADFIFEDLSKVDIGKLKA